MKKNNGGEKEPVSKLTKKCQEEKETKNGARRAAYAATTFEAGVYLCFGRTNINDATTNITEAGIEWHEEEL